MRCQLVGRDSGKSGQVHGFHQAGQVCTSPVFRFRCRDDGPAGQGFAAAFLFVSNGEPPGGSVHTQDPVRIQDREAWWGLSCRAPGETDRGVTVFRQGLGNGPCPGAVSPHQHIRFPGRRMPQFFQDGCRSGPALFPGTQDIFGSGSASGHKDAVGQGGIRCIEKSPHIRVDTQLAGQPVQLLRR